MLNQHVVEIPTLPVDQCHSPPHPILEGKLRHSFVTPSRREGPPSIWDTHGISGNFFCKSRCVIISTLSSRTASMEFIDRRVAPFIHSGEKWKARTRSRFEMPVWTVKPKIQAIFRRGLFKELWGRPTTTADFGSSLWQVPYTSNSCLLEDKVQDRGMYLFAISYGSDAMDQRSGVGWFSRWFKIFVINTRYFKCQILKYSMRGLLQRWTRSSIILTSKEESVWRNKKAKKQDRFLRGRQIAYLMIYEYFRVTWSQQFCRELCRLVHYQSFEMTIFQEFDSKWDGIFIVYDENPHLMISWKDCFN